MSRVGHARLALVGRSTAVESFTPTMRHQIIKFYQSGFTPFLSQECACIIMPEGGGGGGERENVVVWG